MHHVPLLPLPPPSCAAPRLRVQVFLPVLTPHVGLSPLAGHEVVPQLYGLLRDMLMAQAGLDSAGLGSGGEGGGADAQAAMGLEHMGLALTMGELVRVPPAAGGASVLILPCFWVWWGRG